jgi:hypothetical protein
VWIGNAANFIAVPEPTAATLAMFTAICCLRTRWRMNNALSGTKF